MSHSSRTESRHRSERVSSIKRPSIKFPSPERSKKRRRTRSPDILKDKTNSKDYKRTKYHSKANEKVILRPKYLEHKSDENIKRSLLRLSSQNTNNNNRNLKQIKSTLNNSKNSIDNSKELNKKSVEIITKSDEKNLIQEKSYKPNEPLDLIVLGKLSKEKILKEKIINLPDARNYSFEKEKEIYHRNMYKLIVTARYEINKRDQEIEELKIKLKSRSAIACPQCQHKFNTDENRFMPRYIKVLQGSNRVELQFNEKNHLKEWLILNNLDIDQNGIPVLIPKQIDFNSLTLSDVNSSIDFKN